MIKNYNDFVNQVVQTYVNAYAPELWTDIKYEETIKQKDPRERRVKLMYLMNDRLDKYKRNGYAEKAVNEVLSQINELSKSDKNELGYEILNKLTEHIRDTLWKYYWEEQLQNLTRNLDLNFTNFPEGEAA